MGWRWEKTPPGYNISMKLYQMADPVRYARMTTAELRDTFLIEHLFQPDSIDFAYVDLDRTVIGSAIPVTTALTLETSPELRAEYFLERREMGMLNVGGPGTVVVDGAAFDVAKFDCVYAGRGVKSVTFASANDADPAVFYLLSYPAHTAYPTAIARFADLKGLALGTVETCNKRTIYKAIFADGVKSCQLVMGFTVLDPGGNWNTMPPHTHMRRSEIYFYFDVEPAHRVIHLMGPPDATSHLVVANHQVVVSPGWSIHAGVGTKNYAFCWGMGGENQAYDDMDGVTIADLK
jgi:4-deoxy-L-threo-5-hexosulose-uronate ketol-isomerase